MQLREPRAQHPAVLPAASLLLCPPLRQISGRVGREGDPRLPGLFDQREEAVSGFEVHRRVAALRFLYKVTLRRDWTVEDVLPLPQEATEAARHPQPRGSAAVPRLGAGEHQAPRDPDHLLRRGLAHLSEAVHLKPTAITTAREIGRLRVEQGKRTEGPLRDALLHRCSISCVQLLAGGAAQAMALPSAIGPARRLTRDTVAGRLPQGASSLPDCPNPSRRTVFATLSPSIYWRPGTDCCPHYSTTARSPQPLRPLPAICGSLPARYAGSASPWSCCRVRCPPYCAAHPTPALLSRAADGTVGAMEVADVFRRYGSAYRAQHDAQLSTAAAPRHDRDRTLAAPLRLAVMLEQCDSMRSSAHLLLQLSKQALSKMPITGPCSVVGRPTGRASRHAILSRRPDAARSDCQHCLSEQGGGLRHPLPGSVRRSLQTIAADPKHLGAEVGFFAVLHTWGQHLLHHPHLHCVVTGGGLRRDGNRWIACRPGFFLPVRVLSRLFRRLFLTYLQKRLRCREAAILRIPRTLAGTPRVLPPSRSATLQAAWVVYAKAPFAGPEQVLDYVGRYTHRVAISNNQACETSTTGTCVSPGSDYRHHDQPCEDHDPLRRWSSSVVFFCMSCPRGFHHIRYYGLLGNRHRAEKLACCRRLLGMTLFLNQRMAKINRTTAPTTKNSPGIP